MDYESIDRAASRYVLTCTDPHGVAYYIADAPGEPATTIPNRARLFRDGTDAAIFARTDAAHWRESWQRWEPLPAIALSRAVPQRSGAHDLPATPTTTPPTGSRVPARCAADARTPTMLREGPACARQATARVESPLLQHPYPLCAHHAETWRLRIRVGLTSSRDYSVTDL